MRGGVRTVFVGMTLGLTTALGGAQDRAADVRKAQGAPAFGLNDDHYVRIGATEFLPDGSQTTYTSTWNPGVPDGYTYRRYWAGEGYAHFFAWVHAPGGAFLDYVELDDCDNNTTYALTMNVYACDGLGRCNSTPIATIETAEGCGGDSATLDPVTVDNLHGEYMLEVVFPAEVIDGSLQLAGAVVGWRYQVSPAPNSATFNDVPTTHPFFQFVEALAASGITAGCQTSPPLYCPNAPLTRAQMAAFLSKALGLYWGGY
jgi:hypothetical protein